MKYSNQALFEQLPLPATSSWPEGVWDIEAFKHNDLSLILFAPEGKDYQSAHQQDEIYFIIQGEGILQLENEHIEFSAGDALFVPALKQHRFIEFSAGTKMWAIFWGEQHVAE